MNNSSTIFPYHSYAAALRSRSSITKRLSIDQMTHHLAPTVSIVAIHTVLQQPLLVYKLSAACVIPRWDCNRLPRGYGIEAGQEVSNQPCKFRGNYSHTLTLPTPKATPAANGRASVHETQPRAIQLTC